MPNKAKTLQNGQEGTIHGVLALCKFMQDHNLDARFRGDLVIFIPRREPQSDVDFARALSLRVADQPLLDPDATDTSMEARNE